MSRPASMQIRQGLALTVLAGGLVLALYTLSTLSDALHKLDRKTADLATLKRLAVDWHSSQQALAPFEALATKQPPSLTELAAKTLPGITPNIRQRESQAAANGWSVRRMEMKFDAPSAVLGNFLAAAEAARPPWRLVEFDLVAGVPAPDSVRATFLLEALEKK
ncbi:MAG: hypothetical protein NTY53_08935 [Kiritimatiellaeota bacterium]|nr:hypothetical protein [Kiritimatiellota bacterium]